MILPADRKLWCSGTDAVHVAAPEGPAARNGYGLIRLGKSGRGERVRLGLSRPINTRVNPRPHAREADDDGKTKNCGRLVAWAGLDLGDGIAGEVLRCPAQGAERVDGREHSFLLQT
jgi:hypothetical protein